MEGASDAGWVVFGVFANGEFGVRAVGGGGEACWWMLMAVLSREEDDFREAVA